MLTLSPSGYVSFDPMPEIIEIVRDSIKDGKVMSVSLEDFDDTVSQLDGNNLENYLQNLWDEI